MTRHAAQRRIDRDPQRYRRWGGCGQCGNDGHVVSDGPRWWCVCVDCRVKWFACTNPASIVYGRQEPDGDAADLWSYETRTPVFPSETALEAWAFWRHVMEGEPLTQEDAAK